MDVFEGFDRVEAATYRAAHSRHGLATEIARSAGYRNVRVFLNQLDPGQPHSPLSLLGFVCVVVHSGDPAPLRELCALLGFAVYPLPPRHPGDADLIESISALHAQIGKFDMDVHTTLTAHHVDHQAVMECEHDALSVVSALLDEVAVLHQMEERRD